MDTAVVTIICASVVQIVGTVVGLFTLWLNLKYKVEKVENAATEAAIKAKAVEVKIDTNTQLTRDGTAAAETAAKDASVAAKDASNKADTLASRLNGDLDRKIKEIVKAQVEPILKAFCDHNEQDDRHMKEIRAALTELRKMNTK